MNAVVQEVHDAGTDGGMSVTDRRNTIPKYLRLNASRFSVLPACREKKYGIWQSWNWVEVNDHTRNIALGLVSLGLRRGDRLVIIGANRPHLYWSMVAAQCIGAIPVPVYQDSVAEEMKFVLNHSEACLAVVEDQEQVDKVLSIIDDLPTIQHIIYADPRGMRKYQDGRLHQLADVERQGAEHESRHTDYLDQEIDKGRAEDDGVILYTSGTTGNPKGVVLTNGSLVRSALDSSQFDRLNEKEEVLAYLPMAWVGDFIFSIAQAYCCGFCVSCPESAETMMQDLREIGPTYFFAPPRIYETILTSSMIRIEDTSAVKRWMWRYFIAHANQVGPRILDGQPVSLVDRAKYWLGELLVYGPLKNVLGFSRVRVGYTAGEAIGAEIFLFFRSLGINLQQLYGQTESCVYIAQQPDGEVFSDSVGIPCAGVELRIDPDNSEVQYRSPISFREYHRNPVATAETIDADGWVHTGDAGFIDERNGHLRIIDRAKDVGKLCCGSMFAPKYIENKLKFHPAILEAIAFGDGCDFVCAIINIDLTAVGNWAERNGVAYSSYLELSQHPRVGELIGQHVAETNQKIVDERYLSHCQIQRFLILHKEFDADDGEMTRTRKLRRRIIAERYAPLIEALFNGTESVFARTEVTYEDGRKGEISANLNILMPSSIPSNASSRQKQKAA